MSWLSPTLFVCLRCRTLIGTYLLGGFVRADCAVLAVLQYHHRCSTTTCSYMAQQKGLAPRAASAVRYARSQGRVEQNANKGADREVHEFRYKITTCKCQELHAPG